MRGYRQICGAGQVVAVGVRSCTVQELQVPARSMDPKACAEEAVSRSRMSCAVATELTDSKTCFVSFSTPECIAVDAFR